MHTNVSGPVLSVNSQAGVQAGPPDLISKFTSKSGEKAEVFKRMNTKIIPHADKRCK